MNSIWPSWCRQVRELEQRLSSVKAATTRAEQESDRRQEVCAWQRAFKIMPVFVRRLKIRLLVGDMVPTLQATLLAANECCLTMPDACVMCR